MSQERPTRVRSIDGLRAITMLLMIWVNDFSTLTGVSKWLKHAPSGANFIGFSDLIFPVFLFVVGLSNPFSIMARDNANYSRASTYFHIVMRTCWLLVIGVFIVNYENASNDMPVFNQAWWSIFMTLGVFMIWMDWQASPVPEKWHKPIQVIGIALLVFLAVMYRGGEDATVRFSTLWWGILGLIGWAYLANAMVAMFGGNKLWFHGIAFVVFYVLTILNFAGPLSTIPFPLSYAGTIIQGYIPAFTSAGLVTAVLVLNLKTRPLHLLTAMVAFALINIVFGLAIEPYYWMVYKLAVSNAFSILAFAVMYFLVEVRKYTNWYKAIGAAGSATLTCYMLPYIFYPLRTITGWRLPDALNNGLLGLIGSLCFAFIIVFITHIAKKRGFKLKL